MRDWNAAPEATACGEVDPEDQYDRDTQAFLLALNTYVVENFGERCKDYEPDCTCCRIWKLRDEFSEIVAI